MLVHLVSLNADTKKVVICWNVVWRECVAARQATEQATLEVALEILITGISNLGGQRMTATTYLSCWITLILVQKIVKPKRIACVRGDMVMLGGLSKWKGL